LLSTIINVVISAWLKNLAMSSWGDVYLARTPLEVILSTMFEVISESPDRDCLICGAELISKGYDRNTCCGWPTLHNLFKINTNIPYNPGSRVLTCSFISNTLRKRDYKKFCIIFFFSLSRVWTGIYASCSQLVLSLF